MKPRVLVSPNLTKPAQGVTDQIRLDLRYVQMLESCGASVIVACPHSDLDDLSRLSHAWLITGGDDLPSELPGEPLHPAACVVHSLRIAMERRLYEIFRNTPKPILGICFGCQLLNVIEGGTLVQHIPDLSESAEHRDCSHRVMTEPETLLRAVIGEEAVVVSSHHQAIRSPAPGWRVAARAEDGIIEAIEQEGHSFRIGVQWHPERTPDSPATRALFAAFVQAATRRAARAPRG